MSEPEICITCRKLLTWRQCFRETLSSPEDYEELSCETPGCFGEDPDEEHIELARECFRQGIKDPSIIKELVEFVREVGKCKCEECWTDRDLHAPECLAYWAGPLLSTGASYPRDMTLPVDGQDLEE